MVEILWGGPKYGLGLGLEFELREVPGECCETESDAVGRGVEEISFFFEEIIKIDISFDSSGFNPVPQFHEECLPRD